VSVLFGGEKSVSVLFVERRRNIGECPRDPDLGVKGRPSCGVAALRHSHPDHPLPDLRILMDDNKMRSARNLAIGAKP